MQHNDAKIAGIVLLVTYKVLDIHGAGGAALGQHQSIAMFCLLLVVATLRTDGT